MLTISETRKLWLSLVAASAFICQQGSAQQLESFMPDDQLLFERSLSNLNMVASEAIAAHNSGNPYRANKLQEDFHKVFATVFAPRSLKGWLCRYDWLEEGRNIDGMFENYIAIRCNGDSAQYLLLALKGDKTTSMLAEMTFGRALGVGGQFFEDQKQLYHIQLNRLNFIGPIIFLSQ